MSLANSYAKALYEQVRMNGKQTLSNSEFLGPLLDQLERELDLMSQSLSLSKEMKIALTKPITTKDQKLMLADSLCQYLKISALGLRFIRLLVKKGRLAWLTEIRDSFRKIRLAAEGTLLGSFVSAVEIQELDIAVLSELFENKLRKKVLFEVAVDPKFLAGIRVTVNGVTYDGTLFSQLQRIRNRFLE